MLWKKVVFIIYLVSIGLFFNLCDVFAAKGPAFTLKSPIPKESDQDALALQGVATDDQGVETVKVSVENRGITGTVTLTMAKRTQEPFNIKIPLDFGQSNITITVINTQGQKEQKTFTVLRPFPDRPTRPTATPMISTPTPLAATPTPLPPTPLPFTPTPTPSQLDLLLQEADNYFEQKWFMTGPNGKNAYDVYQQILELEPQNPQARKRIYEMIRTYTSWGDNNAQQGSADKARTYYGRSLEMALYLFESLGDYSIQDDIQELQAGLEALSVTPTPTVTPTSIPVIATPEPLLPTPTPSPLPIPTATPPAPTPIPTATPEPLIVPPSSDQVPSLQLLSEIPSKTTEANLTVKGIATDDQGVTEVIVTLQRPNSKGLIIESDLDEELKGAQRELPFTRELDLEPGTNEILIVARDTAGQEQQQKFRILVDAPTIQQGDVYAVIIGIGTYEDPRLNLRYTVNDAQGLYDLLIDPNYGGVPEDHIQFLLNEQATDRKIKGAIGKWLSQNAEEDDTVIIYYSGHGAPEGDETYWVTYNADIDDLYTTALSNNEIADMLSRIQSKRVVTFLDSCYSAATVYRKDRTRSTSTSIPLDMFSGTGRVTISASDGRQLSLELEEYKHGVFTYYLLEGLHGKADNDGNYIVDVDEIWDYVKYQVSRKAKEAGNPQTPMFQGAMTAGIPLTVNQGGLVKKQQQERLLTLFEENQISFEHFECGVRMLDAGQANRYLEGLLNEKLSLDIFNRFFKCDTQQ